MPKRTRNRSKRTRPPKPRVLMGPVQIRSNVLYRHRFRFTSTSTALTSITPRTLIQSTGVVAATAILGYSFVSAVKVQRIELWAPIASQGASATTSCFWLSATTNLSEVEVSDTTMSSAQPAHVITQPPPMSLAAFWQTDSTGNLFSLVVPVGGVIDVFLEMILCDGTSTVLASPLVLVGATPSAVYYEPLDGRGGVYTPVSLQTN